MELTLNINEEKTRRVSTWADQLNLSTEDIIRRIVEGVIGMTDEDLIGWLETMDILSDHEFTSKLVESIRQAENGEVVSWDQTKMELGLA